MDRILTKLSKYINKYLNTRIVFLIDLCLSLIASLMALLLVRVFMHTNLVNHKSGLLWLGASFIFSFFFIWIMRTYRIIIRHTTLKDLSKFVVVAILKVMAVSFVSSSMIDDTTVLYMVMVADFFITFAFFFVMRVAMLMTYDAVKGRMDKRRRCQNVLVYGVGVRSVSLIARLEDSPDYDIVGFLQFGKSTVNHIISEKKTFYVNSEARFNKAITEAEADAILFATEEEARMEKDRMIKYAVSAGLKLLFAPEIDEMVDGKVAHSLRNIEIEDLLMRSEIKISMDKIVSNFQGKTVMVTGAAGSIGSELCRQLASLGIKELILFDNAETPMHNLRLELEEKFPDLDFIPVIGDVRLLPRLDYAFRKWRPQVVFHAAAYKHVPLMEDNPCEAVLVNVSGTRHVADKCLEYDVEKMVMVSTDKAVNPTNVMGCTKRLAEIYVQSMGLAIEKGKIAGKTKFVTTRFGNVLGSNGSVIPRFRDQIAKGGPVTVTHPDITRFFMTIPEACRLVMEAAAMSEGNQIFVFDMGESVKIDDLARRMIYLAGYKPDEDIKIEYTGLRPGEKLYEEVLATSENTLPTDHSRIRIAKVREYDFAEASVAADALERLSGDVRITEMVRLMKQIVPEFISKNSKFEEFDRTENLI